MIQSKPTRLNDKLKSVFKDKIHQPVTKELLFGTFTGNTTITGYRIQNEDIVKEKIEKGIRKNIKNAGLIVDHGLSFLAASPGLVDNNSLAKIKCPASTKSINVIDGIAMKEIKCCIIKKRTAVSNVITTAINILYILIMVYDM